MVQHGLPLAERVYAKHDAGESGSDRRRDGEVLGAAGGIVLLGALAEPQRVAAVLAAQRELDGPLGEEPLDLLRGVLGGEERVGGLPS